MTVGIAAISFSENAIVAVCDEMLSTGGGWSRDNAAHKFLTIGSKWMYVFAANDISPVDPIHEGILLRHSSGAMDEADVRSVRTNIAEAYADELRELREHAVLSDFGVSMNEFVSRSGAMSPSLVEDIIGRIKQVEFKVSLLVFGHDGKGEANVFSVEPPGIPVPHDIERYGVIGSGLWPATVSLMKPTSNRITIPATVYEVCAAKFEAEQAAGVGKSTYLFVVKRDSRQLMFYSIVDEVRAIWQAKQEAAKISEDEHGRVKSALSRIGPLENVLL